MTLGSSFRGKWVAIYKAVEEKEEEKEEEEEEMPVSGQGRARTKEQIYLSVEPRQYGLMEVTEEKVSKRERSIVKCSTEIQ